MVKVNPDDDPNDDKKIFTKRDLTSEQVGHVELPFTPVIVMTDRKRFNKMMRIISGTEESWRLPLLANNSEGNECLCCSPVVNLSL